MTTVLAVPAFHGRAENHRSPRQIIDSLDGAIDKAHKLGDLWLFDSTMSSVEEGGVQVRYEQRRTGKTAKRRSISFLFLSLALN